MKKLLTLLTACVLGAAGFGASAAGLSPATGDPGTGPLPFILGGIGLVAVIALVAVTILDQKKKKDAAQPPQDQDAQAAGQAATQAEEPTANGQPPEQSDGEPKEGPPQA